MKTNKKNKLISPKFGDLILKYRGCFFVIQLFYVWYFDMLQIFPLQPLFPLYSYFFSTISSGILFAISIINRITLKEISGFWISIMVETSIVISAFSIFILILLEIINLVFGFSYNDINLSVLCIIHFLPILYSFFEIKYSHFKPNSKIIPYTLEICYLYYDSILFSRFFWNGKEEIYPFLSLNNLIVTALATTIYHITLGCFHKLYSIFLLKIMKREGISS